MPITDLSVRTLRFLNRLGVRKPVMQGPVSFVTTPRLVSAVSNDGALGTLACAWQHPASMRQQLKQVRRRTHYPFAVSLMACADNATAQASASNAERAHNEALRAFNAQMNAYREQLGLAAVDDDAVSADRGVAMDVQEHEDEDDDLPAPPSVHPSSRGRGRKDRVYYRVPFEVPNLDDQIAVVLEEDVPIVTFSMGVPDTHIIKALKKQHVVIMGTATTVEEGRLLEDAGCDVVIAQGYESGGMRCSWLDPAHPGIGTMALVPSMADKLSVPIVASGGIMDGRGIAAVLSLGASCAQMSTAFLCVRENMLSEGRRLRLAQANESTPVLTNVWTGRSSRFLPAPKFETDVAEATEETGVPPFPQPLLWSLDVQSKAGDVGDDDLHTIWAGQGVGLLPSAETPTVKQFMRGLSKQYFSSVDVATDIRTSMQILRKDK